MVICDDCKFTDAGCVAKDAVLASGSPSCKFYSIQVMKKTAEKEQYIVSWPVGDKRIVQTNKDGRVHNVKILDSGELNERNCP